MQTALAGPHHEYGRGSTPVEFKHGAHKGRDPGRAHLILPHLLPSSGSVRRAVSSKKGTSPSPPCPATVPSPPFKRSHHNHSKTIKDFGPDEVLSDLCAGQRSSEVETSRPQLGAPGPSFLVAAEGGGGGWVGRCCMGVSWPPQTRVLQEQWAMGAERAGNPMSLNFTSTSHPQSCMGDGETVPGACLKHCF